MRFDFCDLPCLHRSPRICMSKTSKGYKHNVIFTGENWKLYDSYIDKLMLNWSNWFSFNNSSARLLYGKTSNQAL